MLPLPTLKNSVSNYKEAPANTPLSDTISKDLKKRGFKFVGSTVVFGFSQAKNEKEERIPVSEFPEIAQNYFDFISHKVKYLICISF